MLQSKQACPEASTSLRCSNTHAQPHAYPHSSRPPRAFQPPLDGPSYLPGRRWRLAPARGVNCSAWAACGAEPSLASAFSAHTTGDAPRSPRGLACGLRRQRSRSDLRGRAHASPGRAERRRSPSPGSWPPRPEAAEPGATSLCAAVQTDQRVSLQADTAAQAPLTVAGGSGAASTTTPTDTQPAEQPSSGLPWPKLWAIAILSISYVHQAASSFSIPAILPMITKDLGLTDLEGGFLTSGYLYVYALALVPVGLVADRIARPQLLAAGLTLWSTLTIAASSAQNYGELLAARVGFAAAQATQNPVSFSLIPDLFPNRKATAMSIYNTAIYLGRALAFSSPLLANQSGLFSTSSSDLASAVTQLRMVPLDDIDYLTMTIVYVAGDMAAVMPMFDYAVVDNPIDFSPLPAGADLAGSNWRSVLRMIALPGFVIAAAMLLTVKDPRSVAASKAAAPLPPPAPAPAATPLPPSTAASSAASASAASSSATVASSTAVATSTTTTAAAAAATSPAVAAGILALLKSAPFLTITFGAAMNDIGTMAFVAWQSTFYERVYDLEPSQYAPLLAAVLPLGGIVGGLGGGFLADQQAKSSGRQWVTSGASVLSAPMIVASIQSHDYKQSIFFLLAGFALCEAWRAPTAIAVRKIAPPDMGSTASALYLCIRNLLGGLGPLSVALLSQRVGLQTALLVTPACYLMSGLTFLAAELMAEQKDKLAKQQQRQQEEEAERQRQAAASAEAAPAAADPGSASAAAHKSNAPTDS